MDDRIRENDVVLPALRLLAAAPGGRLSTTALKRKLIAYFQPDGEDAGPLKNRNDMKFTQIVRNLKSHKKLEKNGWAVEVPRGFQITEAGRDYVDSQS